DRNEQQQLVDLFLNISRGREHKIIMFEIANEYWQNGFSGDEGRNYLRQFSRYMKDRTDILVAASAPINPEDSLAIYQDGVADIATLHLDRDVNKFDGYWRPVRQAWNEPKGLDIPASNN